MPFSLLPRYLARDLTAVTPAFLKDAGIRLLLLDFDNTVIPYTTNTPTPEMKAWFQTMTAAGITLCVVSNSRKQRAPRFCREYGIECIINARKPLPTGIHACLKRFGVSAEQAAMAGDQIYTDTLAANLAGVCSILVPSIHNHNFWLKARHLLEKPFIYLARKRRMTL